MHQRTELVKVLDIIYGLDQIDDCSNVHDKKVSGLGLHVIYTYCYCFTVHSSSKKVKVAHTRLHSVVPGLIPVLGRQPAGDVIINPTVGCHYFSPGLQLLPQSLRGLLPILLLGEQWV